MKMRQLLSVASGDVLGAVILDGKARRFEGGAFNVLSGVRRRYGDDETVDQVMTDGWANQSLYFGEVIDDAAS